MSLISPFPLSASAGKARRGQCFRVRLFSRSLTPLSLAQSLYTTVGGGTFHLHSTHCSRSLSHRRVLYIPPRCTPLVCSLIEKRVFGEMTKTEIDVWVRPRPDHQELGRLGSECFRSCRRIDGPRHEEGMGKMGHGRHPLSLFLYLSLSLQVFLQLSCFVLSLVTIPEDTARKIPRYIRRARRPPHPPLRYHHIRWETTHRTIFFISQAFSWETTQHPSNALFRYGWEAYDSL